MPAKEALQRASNMMCKLEVDGQLLLNLDYDLSRDALFGGSDIDYRDTEASSQGKPTGPTTVDTDRIFELNNKCFSLAEEKYKSKELSTEEYQATLRLLQNILQDEAQRLTVAATFVFLSKIVTCVSTCSFSRLIFSAPSAFVNPSTTISQANAMSTLTNPTTSTVPFAAQPFLPFGQQASTAGTPFPFADFGNETQRHALQILSAVGASFPYASHYNLLPYLPPLPPAPPSFTLVSNTFPSQASSSSGHFHGRQSPPSKRPHDENGKENHHNDEDAKRKRYDPTAGHSVSSHNFDEENIAPVPSLLDANINTLKKYDLSPSVPLECSSRLLGNTWASFSNCTSASTNAVRVVSVSLRNRSTPTRIIWIGISGRINRRRPLRLACSLVEIGIHLCKNGQFTRKISMNKFATISRCPNKIDTWKTMIRNIRRHPHRQRLSHVPLKAMAMSMMMYVGHCWSADVDFLSILALLRLSWSIRELLRWQSRRMALERCHTCWWKNLSSYLLSRC